MRTARLLHPHTQHYTIIGRFCNSEKGKFAGCGIKGLGGGGGTPHYGTVVEWGKAGGRIRTDNLPLTKRPLYRSSYTGMMIEDAGNRHLSDLTPAVGCAPTFPFFQMAS
jgi:hypothetical protein